MALRMVAAGLANGGLGWVAVPARSDVRAAFLSGTRIRCPGGPRPVEALRPRCKVSVYGAVPRPWGAPARTPRAGQRSMPPMHRIRPR
jgi:hypothetical protein